MPLVETLRTRMWRSALLYALILGTAVLVCRHGLAENTITSASKTKSAADAAKSAAAYRIGPGDILQINVLKEPEASVASVVVRSDGAISIPLLKEIGAAGRTPGELEGILTMKLSRLIRDPDVT